MESDGYWGQEGGGCLGKVVEFQLVGNLVGTSKIRVGQWNELDQKHELKSEMEQRQG